MADADTRGPLAREIDRLAFQCLLETGRQATHIYLPRKSRSEVKEFVEALVAEIPELGTAPFVFDCFWRQERPAQFQGLRIAMYDGDRMIVGGESYLQ